MILKTQRSSVVVASRSWFRVPMATRLRFQLQILDRAPKQI